MRDCVRGSLFVSIADIVLRRERINPSGPHFLVNLTQQWRQARARLYFGVSFAFVISAHEGVKSTKRSPAFAPPVMLPIYAETPGIRA